MRMITRMIVVVMLLIGIGICIGGCSSINNVSVPTPEQLKAADCGSYPDNYQDIVINYMDGILIDPESVRYNNWKGPVIGWAGDDKKGYSFGYAVCVDINAKNTMGGYTGTKPMFLIIYNGIVKYHKGGYPRGSEGEARVCKMCDEVLMMTERIVK